MNIIRRIARSSRAGERFFSCTLSQSLGKHYAQGVEENTERIQKILSFRDPDPYISIILLQRMCYFGGEDFELKNVLVDKVANDIQKYSRKDHPLTITQNMGEELVILLKNFISLDRDFDQKESQLIENGIKAIITILPMYNKESRAMISKLVEELDAKQERYSDEIRRQITVSKELIARVSLLKNCQIRQFYINRLGLEDLLRQEKDLEFEYDDLNNNLLVIDHMKNVDLDIAMISDYNLESQLHRVSESFAQNPNLRHIAVDCPPLLIKKHSHLKMKKVKEDPWEMLRHDNVYPWDYDHLITNANFNEFYNKAVLDPELYSEKEGIFRFKYGERSKSIDSRTSLFASFLLNKQVGQQYTIGLFDLLLEEVLANSLFNLDIYQAKYLHELGLIMNLLHYGYIYKKGVQIGCKNCNSKANISLLESLGSEDAFDYCSKLFRSDILGITGIKSRTAVNIIHGQINKVSASDGCKDSHQKIHTFISNSETSEILKNLLLQRQAERTAGFDIGKYDRASMYRDLKDNKLTEGMTENFIWKLIYLEQALGVSDSKYSLFCKEDNDAQTFVKYEIAFNQVLTRMSVNDWNPRSPEHSDQIQYNCEADQILDYGIDYTKAKTPGFNPRKMLKDNNISYMSQVLDGKFETALKVKKQIEEQEQTPKMMRFDGIEKLAHRNIKAMIKNAKSRKDKRNKKKDE